MVYTNTSGFNFAPLKVPSQPAAASLALKLFFSNTISPQRLKMRNVFILNKPDPLGKKMSLAPSPFGENVLGINTLAPLQITKILTLSCAVQPPAFFTSTV